MLKIDKLQLDLIINGDASRLQLARLRTEAAELRKEIKGIKDQTFLGTKKAELANLDDSIEKIIHQIGLTGLSMKELASRAGTLKMALNQMAPDNALFKPYQKELKDISARMNEFNGKAQQSKYSFGAVADSLNKYQTMIMAGTAALTGMILGIKGLLSAQGDLADSLAERSPEA